jgi:hypothetical protein
MMCSDTVTSKNVPDLNWLIELVEFYWSREYPDRAKELRYEDIPHFFQDLRNCFDNFDEGNWLSLLDGLQICRDNMLPVPEWLAAGIRKFVIDSVIGTKQGKKGRGNSPLGQATDALKREKRAEVFSRIRFAQKFDPTSPIFAVSLPPETTALIKSGKLKSIGNTRDDALDVTFSSLQGTFAQASLATLDRMMTEYSSTENAFLVSNQLRKDLGLPYVTDDRPDLLGPYAILDLDQIGKGSE